MEYKEMMEKIKKSTEEHIKNARKTKKETSKISVLKESELIFRNANKMDVFLGADKQKYKYVGFCYAEGHYVNFLHFTASIKEFNNIGGHTTIYCIVKLDKTLDYNYYIEVTKKALQQLKLENLHDIDYLTDKNNNVDKNNNTYKKNYNSFKEFLVREKLSQFEKQKKNIIKMAESDIELL